jgi:hypothetical protein
VKVAAIAALSGCLLAGCRSGALPAAGAAPVATVPESVQRAAAVDATTLDRKLLFGYQGWFGCPGDGSPLNGWEHWFRRGGPATAATLRVDMWPDVSELAADERCQSQSLPSDWYRQLAREAQKQLRSVRPRTLARPLEVGK